MKTFMAIYTGNSPAMADWNALDAGTRAEREKAGMAAWQAWATRNADVIVDQGAPLGKTKRISSQHEAAAKLFVDHPHFTIFPGDGVEVMECLPMPGM